MAGLIDTIGVYRGDIREATITLSRAEKPQWAVRIGALEKYAETPEELAHYGLEEPGWVDYSANDEEIVDRLLLFNSATDFDDSTKMMNYDQIQLATGWTGESFDALQDDSLLGKIVLFRVGENNYVDDKGKEHTRLQISWIDKQDASPTRSLTKLEDDKVKGLDALLRKGGLGAKKKVAPATAPKPAASKPAAKPTGGKAEPAAAEAPDTSKPPATKAKAPTPPPAKKAEEPAEEVTQLSAWNDLQAAGKAAGKDDTAVTDAWINAASAVGDKDEKDYTSEDWATLRDAAVAAIQG